MTVVLVEVLFLIVLDWLLRFISEGVVGSLSLVSCWLSTVVSPYVIALIFLGFFLGLLLGGLGSIKAEDWGSLLLLLVRRLLVWFVVQIVDILVHVMLRAIVSVAVLTSVGSGTEIVWLVIGDKGVAETSTVGVLTIDIVVNSVSGGNRWGDVSIVNLVNDRGSVSFVNFVDSWGNIVGSVGTISVIAVGAVRVGTFDIDGVVGVGGVRMDTSVSVVVSVCGGSGGSGGVGHGSSDNIMRVSNLVGGVLWGNVVGALVVGWEVVALVVALEVGRWSEVVHAVVVGHMVSGSVVLLDWCVVVAIAVMVWGSIVMELLFMVDRPDMSDLLVDGVDGHVGLPGLDSVIGVLRSVNSVVSIVGTIDTSVVRAVGVVQILLLFGSSSKSGNDSKDERSHF